MHGQHLKSDTHLTAVRFHLILSSRFWSSEEIWQNQPFNLRSWFKNVFKHPPHYFCCQIICIHLLSNEETQKGCRNSETQLPSRCENWFRLQLLNFDLLFDKYHCCDPHYLWLEKSPLSILPWKLHKFWRNNLIHCSSKYISRIKFPWKKTWTNCKLVSKIVQGGGS